jgi:hypothetical protein
MNSEQRMQNPEVNLRDRLRGQTLNTTYSRQFGEQFVPTIETTVSKLRRRGFLGVVQGSEQDIELQMKGITPKYIPEAVVNRMKNGEEYYRIEFVSPAAQIMQAEELKGIEYLISTTQVLAPLDPSVMDNMDIDWIYRRLQELGGAPRETIRSVENLIKIRDDRAKMQAAEMQLAAAQQASETARNTGQAVNSVASAGKAA